MPLRPSNARLLATPILAVLLLAGCGASDAPPVSSPAAGPGEPFQRYGYPGPWWREGASHAEFDADLDACRASSRQARESAAAELRKDAAYRAFVDCMQQRDWSRGHG